MIEVRFTLPFIRRLKPLTKRYRKIQSDIQPIIEQLQNVNLVGDQIAGLDFTIFKVRAKNSDIPTGKSGGYRVIYQVVSTELILLRTYALALQSSPAINRGLRSSNPLKRVDIHVLTRFNGF